MISGIDMNPEIPQKITEVSAQWITAQLRRTSSLSDITVRSFQHNQIGEDQGNNGDIFRLSLDYDGEVREPRSLVLKVPAAAGGLFDPGQMNILNTGEISFYNELQGTVGLRTPKIYLAVSNSELNHHLILMEDLSALTTDSHQEYVSPDKARFGVQSLARMHARWWKDPRLRQIESIENYAVSSKKSPVAFSESWNAVRPRFSKDLGEYVVRFGDMLEEKIVRVQEHLGSAPVTLNHGDARPNNVIIDTTVDPPEPVFFDWQRPSFRRGAADLANFIGRGVEHSNDTGVVTGLVDHYLTNLLAGGVQDYDADQLLFDFRLGLHVPFHVMVFQASRINPGDGIENTVIPRRKDLFECVDALEALKAL